MSESEKLLNAAKAEVGYHESPPGSNRTKYGKWYGMDGQPWCDMFVSYVANKAGLQKIIGKSAYTPSHANWFKKKGQWGYKPRVGAIVFYRFGWLRRINHVGIVIGVNKNGSITTIEGNTSFGNERNGGSVMIRTRSKNIVGYGYPAYKIKTYEMSVEATFANAKRIIKELAAAGIIHFRSENTDEGIMLRWRANATGREIIKSVFKKLKLEVYEDEL